MDIAGPSSNARNRVKWRVSRHRKFSRLKKPDLILRCCVTKPTGHQWRGGILEIIDDGTAFALGTYPPGPDDITPPDPIAARCGSAIWRIGQVQPPKDSEKYFAAGASKPSTD